MHVRSVYGIIGAKRDTGTPLSFYKLDAYYGVPFGRSSITVLIMEAISKLGMGTNQLSHGIHDSELTSPHAKRQNTKYTSFTRLGNTYNSFG